MLSNTRSNHCLYLLGAVLSKNDMKKQGNKGRDLLKPSPNEEVCIHAWSCHELSSKNFKLIACQVSVPFLSLLPFCGIKKCPITF